MAHTYTCTNATGDIVGVVNTSASACIKYSLSGTSAGSVEGNTEDGIYEKIGNSNITLNGYTGVVYIISGGRVETRILTHDSAVIGDELVVNGGFDDGLNGWNSTGATLTLQSGGVNISITASYGYLNSMTGIPTILGESYGVKFEVLDTTVTGSTYIQVGSSFALSDISSENIGTVDVGVSPISTFMGTGNDVFVRLGFNGNGQNITIDNVSTKKISQETKLYIDGVLQPTTPTIPTGTLKATNIASIGYPDIVDTHYGNLEVYPTILTQEEIDEA